MDPKKRPPRRPPMPTPLLYEQGIRALHEKLSEAEKFLTESMAQSAVLRKRHAQTVTTRMRHHVQALMQACQILLNPPK